MLCLIAPYIQFKHWNSPVECCKVFGKYSSSQAYYTLETTSLIHLRKDMCIRLQAPSARHICERCSNMNIPAFLGRCSLCSLAPGMQDVHCSSALCLPAGACCCSWLLSLALRSRGLCKNCASNCCCSCC